MKERSRYRIFFLLLFITGIAFIYLLIPSSIRVSKEIKIKGYDENIFSFLSDSNHWNKLRDSIPADFTFQITKSIYPRIFIEAEKSSHKIPIEIEIFGKAKIDSCKISWQCEWPAGLTPWARVQAYMYARKLKEIFSGRINLLSEYAGKTENIYGLSIVESKVKDTLVATLTQYESKLPSDSLVCIMIKTLRQQINNSDLSIIDSAMTLMPNQREGKYKVMVGFPVSKSENNSNINIKKMIPGKLLSGTITGGHAAISKGYLQMKKYVLDRGIEEAALPYEVPVTNRCIEKDTTKWITKIYYPVF